VVCERFAEADALILLHDVVCPDVAAALSYLKARRWSVCVYQTMQIVGAAFSLLQAYAATMTEVAKR
jgi:hypothetical protein